MLIGGNAWSDHISPDCTLPLRVPSSHLVKAIKSIRVTVKEHICVRGMMSIILIVLFKNRLMSDHMHLSRSGEQSLDPTNEFTRSA